MFNPFRRKPSFIDLRYEALTIARSIPGHVKADISNEDGTTEEVAYTEDALNKIEDAMADALDGCITQRKARKIIGEELNMMRQISELARVSND